MCVQHQLSTRRFRPRSVRESIPTSRLAHYGDYVYDESRELSYASTGPFIYEEPSSFTKSISPLTSYYNEKVDKVYKWLLEQRPSENQCGPVECCVDYNMPLMRVQGFEDKLMKVQLTADNIKNLWKEEDRNDLENIACTDDGQILIDVHLTPLRNLLLYNNEIFDYHKKTGWFQDISKTKDFQSLENHLKNGKSYVIQLETSKQLEEFRSIQVLQNLSKEFKSLYVSLLGATPDPASTSIVPEQSSTEILYSEVLQGLLSSKRTIKGAAALETLEPPEILTSSIVSDISIQTPRDLTSQTSDLSLEQEAIELLKEENSKEFISYESVARRKRNLNLNITQQTTGKQQFQQQFFPGTKWGLNQSLFMTRQGSGGLFPMCGPYLQHHQSYIYSPTFSCQKWTSTTTFPQTACSATLFNPLFAGKTLENGWIIGKSGFTQNDESNNVSTTNTENVEQHVSASISEELEVQALEQYHNSNENFYKELERQAEEQYGTVPD